jgi:hypothetical protein
MKFARILLPVALAVSCCSPASATTATGTISYIHVMSNGVVLFLMSNSRTGLPTCAAATDPTRFAFNATTAAGQARLSVIMTAYVANKTVTVHGTDACGDWGDTESVDWFHTAP